MKNAVPYIIPELSTKAYYNDLENTANVLRGDAERMLRITIDKFINANKGDLRNEQLSIIELTYIGIMWESYGYMAMATDNTDIEYVNKVRELYNRNKGDERIADAYFCLRAEKLLPDVRKNIQPITIESLEQLLNWLEAADEFKHELGIIQKWLDYWNESDYQLFLYDIYTVLEYIDLFNFKCQKLLGQYLNDEYYQAKKTDNIKIREDYFQIIKSRHEIYFNLVVSNWMNKLHKPEFDKAIQKKVMAPACMRINNGQKCRAQRVGKYLKCTSCNIDCNIQKLSAEGEESGYEVLVLEHQSSFAMDKELLKNAGIIGIACAPCLFSGGMMLRNKNVHAQCVVLNAPGCKKHWTKHGVTTSIDMKQLNIVVDSIKVSQAV